MVALLAFFSGYLLGSISFAWVVARSRGVDLRTVGSGNLGATNVTRALGPRAGLAVFLLDVAKGFVPAFVCLLAEAAPPAAVCAGLGAYAGHIWPVWLRFRGGKGVATLVGALLALAPVTSLLVAPFALMAIALTRFVSLGSLVLGAGLPLAS